MLEKNLLKLKRKYGLHFFEPAPQEKIIEFEKKHGKLPEDLKRFYKVTNGFEYENFTIFPLLNKDNLKRTWDSLEKANAPKSTKFKIPAEDFLSKFLIFGSLEGMDMMLYDKEDSSLWYEDQEGYHKTNLTLIKFIEGMISENKRDTN